eukprot:ANDGO_05158.mRNA.1 hypothetical protein CAOG_01897
MSAASLLSAEALKFATSLHFLASQNASVESVISDFQRSAKIMSHLEVLTEDSAAFLKSEIPEQPGSVRLQPSSSSSFSASASASASASSAGAVAHADFTATELLKTRLAAYDEEVDRLASTIPFSVKTPHSLVRAELGAEMNHEVSALYTLCDFLNARKTDLSRKCETTKSIVSDLQTLNTKLEEQLAKTERESQAALESTQASSSASKTENRTVLNDARQKLMVLLAKFCDKHYPAVEETVPRKKRRVAKSKTSKRDGDNPSDDDDDGDHDERQIRNRAQIIEYTPLKAILEELLNRCVSHPKDPYVDWNQKNAHPVQIEVLIRCGIALQHPQNPMLISLERFHQ